MKISTYSILSLLSLAIVLNTTFASDTDKDLTPSSQFTEQKSASSPILYRRATDQNSLNTLTIEQAVLLALHRNPNINIAINNRKVQRYDLLTAEQTFEPQFSLTGTSSYSKNDYGDSGDNRITQANIGPTMSWKFPLGTQLNANWGYGPTVQSGTGANTSSASTWTITLTQPLLQNFGTDVNEVGLNNAKDDQSIDDLQLKDTVINTISSAMDDYYAVVQAGQTLAIADQSLTESEVNLRNREALLKAGRIPRLDITQTEIDISTQEQSKSQAEQSLNNAKVKLLNDLGLPSDTQFDVITYIDVSPVNPDLKSSFELADKNNIDLQIARLQYQQQQRNLLSSENQQRWTLNLQLQRSHSVTYTNYPDPGVTPNTNNLADNSSASLNLIVPLDNVSQDKAALAAAVALQNQDITLQNAQQSMQSNILAAVQNLQSQWNQLEVSERNLKLSQTNYNAAIIKFKYGQIDAFSLSQQQQQLIQAKISLVNAKISYLQQVRDYEKLVGTILDIWHIQFGTSAHA